MVFYYITLKKTFVSSIFRYLLVILVFRSYKLSCVESNLQLVFDKNKLEDLEKVLVD